MNELDLDLVPDPAASPNVLSARHRRALVVGLGGGRAGDSPRARASFASFAERRLRSTDLAPRVVETPASPGFGSGGVAVPASAASTASTASTAASASRQLALHDALVVPAGAVVRGYLRCNALLLAGDVVGNIHCVAGPVVIRAGASLQGRIVAAGDVYVRGTVGDGGGGGVVITTRGKLTLGPGARVDGDVRCAWLDRHEGAMLNGNPRAGED